MRAANMEPDQFGNVEDQEAALLHFNTAQAERQSIRERPQEGVSAAVRAARESIKIDWFPDEGTREAHQVAREADIAACATKKAADKAARAAKKAADAAARAAKVPDPTQRSVTRSQGRDVAPCPPPLSQAEREARPHLLPSNGPRKGFAQRAAQRGASRERVAACYPRLHQAPPKTEAQGPHSQSRLIPSRADASPRNSGPGMTRTRMTVTARPTILASQPRAILRLRHPDQGQKVPRIASAPEPLETIKTRDRPMPLSATQGSA
jgi:hypothetical protein